MGWHTFGVLRCITNMIHIVKTISNNLKLYYLTIKLLCFVITMLTIWLTILMTLMLHKNIFVEQIKDGEG